MNLLGSEVPASQTALYLRTLPAVRERCERVFELAKEGKLQYFEYHADQETSVGDFCLSIIQVRLCNPMLSVFYLVSLDPARFWIQL